MMAKTHLAFSFLLALLFYKFFNLNTVLFFLIILIVTLLVDIDIKSSLISREFRFFARILEFFFGHRGLFHNYLFWLVLTIVISFYSKLWIPFLIGWLSHLFLDSLSKQGIMIWPFGKIKGFIKVNGFIEKILFYIFILVIIVNLIYLF